MSLRPVLVFAVSLLALACTKSAESGEGEEAKAAPEASASAGQEPQPAAKSETGAEAGAETGAETEDAPEPLEPLPERFEEVGVEACDVYVRDYVACIEKAPEAEREAQRRAVFENVTAWKQMAAGGPSAQKGLETACRIAREQAKRATEAWACEW